MTPRPRPLLGMLLGMLLGLVVVGLLWQLGVIDPGRTVLFATVGIAMLLVAWLLTRDVAYARGRLVTVAVLAGAFGGAAVTGVPDLVRFGSISDGCTLEVQVGETVAVPADTATLTPLEVPDDAVVAWTATSATPVTVTEKVAGVSIGGFDIPVRTVTADDAGEAGEISGTVDVAQAISWIQDRIWLEPSGVYHAYGAVSGGSVECAVDGFVRVGPAGVFATNTLIILWIALGVLLILIAWAAFAVRSSFARARREATTTAPDAGEHPVTPVAPAPPWTPDHAEEPIRGEELPPPPAAAEDAPVAESPEEEPVAEEIPVEDESAVEAQDAGPEDAASEPEPEPEDAEPEQREPEEPEAQDAESEEAEAEEAGSPEEEPRGGEEGEDRIVPADDEGPEPTSEDEDSGPRPA